MTKILVVEDEAPIRERIAKALTYEGYETFQGENGRIGLELAPLPRNEPVHDRPYSLTGKTQGCRNGLQSE